jgi:hypothetical protein
VGPIDLPPQVSWREHASAQAQADLDSLLAASLPFAEEQLARHGKFFPYAVGIDAAGDVAVRAPYDGHKRPRAGEILEWLYEDARRDADRLRAVAFVADVTSSGRDAIGVQLQHREHIAIGIVVPYLRSRYHKQVSFGRVRASEGVPRVWPSPR